MPRPRKRAPLELEQALFTPDEEEETGKETPSAPESAVTLKNVVRFELLEQADPELLRKFLLLYRGHLQSKGINLDDFSPSMEWLETLHAVLQRVDLDPQLQQDLIDLGEMASEEGHQQALRMAYRAQLELFDRDHHQRTIDTALRLFLEHNPLFRNSQASLQATQARDSAIFCARSDAPLSGYQREGKRVDSLRRRLTSFFRHRNCTGYCDIRVTENDEDIGFLIIHGRPPKTYGVIVDQRTRSRTSNVQEVQDVVLFNKATCRLSVQAGLAELRDAYRGVFGTVFFGSQHHFQVKTVVSLDPMLELGAEAFQTAGFPGLRRVTLKQLQVVENNGRRSRWTMEDPDLASRLQEPDHQRILRRGTLCLARMDVFLYGQRRAVPVRLVPPETFKHDRRVGLEQIRAFLVHRGFLLLEPLPLTAPSPGVH